MHTCFNALRARLLFGLYETAKFLFGLYLKKSPNSNFTLVMWASRTLLGDIQTLSRTLFYWYGTYIWGQHELFRNIIVLLILYQLVQVVRVQYYFFYRFSKSLIGNGFWKIFSFSIYRCNQQSNFLRSYYRLLSVSVEEMLESIMKDIKILSLNCR